MRVAIGNLEGEALLEHLGIATRDVNRPVHSAKILIEPSSVIILQVDYVMTHEDIEKLGVKFND